MSKYLKTSDQRLHFVMIAILIVGVIFAPAFTIATLIVVGIPLWLFYLIVTWVENGE